MMNGWRYVFLAYGIVWGTLMVYIFSLKRRFRRAETETRANELSGES
jgi:CcmD family protein